MQLCLGSLDIFNLAVAWEEIPVKSKMDWLQIEFVQSWLKIFGIQQTENSKIKLVKIQQNNKIPLDFLHFQCLANLFQLSSKILKI